MNVSRNLLNREPGIFRTIVTLLEGPPLRQVVHHQSHDNLSVSVDIRGSIESRREIRSLPIQSTRVKKNRYLYSHKSARILSTYSVTSSVADAEHKRTCQASAGPTSHRRRSIQAVRMYRCGAAPSDTLPNALRRSHQVRVGSGIVDLASASGFGNLWTGLPYEVCSLPWEPFQ